MQSQVAEIRMELGCDGGIDMWVVDKNGNESLSYLTIDEAIGLAEELKAAIRRRIDQI